jgi:radical SAM protein with 4Fe4S-binding SPASM domain
MIKRANMGGKRKKMKSLKLEKIDLELTNECNLKCKHCYANANFGREIGRERLTLNQIHRIIEEFAKIGGRRVALTGGEPLMHKNFEEVFYLIVSSGLRIELETSGILLNEKLVKKISREIEYMRYIQISLDGPNEEIHDKIRGLKGAFKKTLRAINLCLKEEIPVRVSTVLMKENKSFILKIFDLVQKIGVTEYRVDAAVPIGRAKNNGISPSEYAKIVKEIYARTAAEGGVEGTKETENEKRNIITPSCGVGENRVAVLSNGLITPCPMIRSLIAGNAFNPGDLSRAVYSKAVRLVRDGLKNSCDSCAERKKCGRGCKARAFVLTKDLNAPDVYRCSVFKRTSFFKKNYLI